MKISVSSFQFPVSRRAASPRRAAPSSFSRRHSSFIIHHSSFRPAFSLVEVLLAIFILGIGLIMVASVFPVGANWTRQTTEDSIGQTVAQNALAVIKAHYGPGGDLQQLRFIDPDFFTNPGNPVPNPANHNSVLQAAPPLTPFTLQALPGFAGIPASERAYQFGSPTPFPAANPFACTYFWSALIRLNPAHQNPANNKTNFIQPASSYKYDLYILVFRKGDPTHQFGHNGSAEVPNTRIYFGPDRQLFIPSLWYAGYQRGAYNMNNGTFLTPPSPPLGQIGIGTVSGTVFRQMLNTGPGCFASPALAVDNAGKPETVIYSPPADGTAASPLIYVYQTTLTF